MSVKRTARAATRCVYSDLKSKAACVSQVGPRGGASTPVSYARVCALATWRTRGENATKAKGSTRVRVRAGARWQRAATAWPRQAVSERCGVAPQEMSTVASAA
eukprot:scaffold128539_cov31-Tisochrysis_lutea.AAC.4